MAEASRETNLHDSQHPALSSERRKPRVVLLGALLLSLCSYLVFLWLLPCFPTTDGPVHMYYVHVFGALLTKSSPSYQHFFRIRHLLPPYSLYYYALLCLGHFMPMLIADRVIISAYFISFTLGFRFLARRIGPAADLMAVGATLLLLNWPLGMGFVNFCLALSFSLWAAGIWLGLLGTRRIPARFGFLLFVSALMLTHPVPLLLLLAVMSATLFARILTSYLAKSGSLRERLPQHWKEDVITLFIAALNVGYVKLFARANPFKQTEDLPLPYLVDLHMRMQHYAVQHGVAFLMGRSPGLLLYRVGLLVVLLLTAFLAAVQLHTDRKNKVWTNANTFFVLGAVAFVVLPFIPSQLNGLYYFADRLLICVWVAFLLAASGWSGRLSNDVSASRQFTWVSVAGLAVIGFAMAGLLVRAFHLLQAPAASIAAVAQRPLPIDGRVGFLFEDERKPRDGSGDSLSWNPYYWAAVHIFRHNNAIMANAPWMDESIIPVAPSAALPESLIVSLRQPFPNKLEGTFRAHQLDLRAALASDDFFVVNQIDRTPAPNIEPLLSLTPDFRKDWHCSPDDLWYRVCLSRSLLSSAVPNH